MAFKNSALRCITVQLILLWSMDQCAASIISDLLENLYSYFGAASWAQSDLNYAYDFIIIGAGSGGSVVANRLSEKSDWNILLLEAGTEEIFLTDIPLLAPVLHITAYNWGYRTEPSPENSEGYCLSMIDRRCNWPRGKAVGGTSVINFMIYSRGSRRDFDSWAAIGNPGWTYSEVLPYFKKFEKAHFRPPQEEENYEDDSIYGKHGNLDITTSPWTSKLRDIFLTSGEELGYKIKDSNDGSPIGFSSCRTNLRNGRRVSASKAFIKPIRWRRNFHLSEKSTVTKIVIDPRTNTAIGVEFLKDSRKYFVRAKKEVILSAGSLNSPQILMLSGVGPKDHLTRFGIDVVQDLPVGYNLQDHVSMGALTFMINDSVSIVESRVASNYKNTFDYLVRGAGPFTLPAGAEALAFIDTDDNHGNEYIVANNIEKNYRSLDRDNYNEPDIELVFGVGSMAGDTSGSLRSIFGLSDEWYRSVFAGYEGQDGFSIVPIVLHPKSRGRVSLRNADPLQSPILEANYFENQEDLHTMVRGIKKAIEIASSRLFRKYNTTLLPVPFPGCRQLQFKSDDYWRCVSRQISTTLGHFVGTCKMAPREAGGVVNERLKVYGINKLRVVDASIMPLLTSGHTNAPTYMIGEKASDMIKEEWMFN